MPVHPRKLEKLNKRLQNVLKQANIESHRAVIQRISANLNIDIIDCAAALLYISQPHLIQNTIPQEPQKPIAVTPANNRNVRYRLDVGCQHNIDPEQLLAVIIEESGVDRSRITRLEIRDNYTLIDLPDGMPADIFQLLSEAYIGEYKLNIKRVKPNRRKLKS
ncbi:MAG: DbpA RNA binding domain-containing protein [Methylomonas lenta]|nr:DbpA RNA binding domain-containing protein [Methylomonas lenta]